MAAAFGLLHIGHSFRDLPLGSGDKSGDTAKVDMVQTRQLYIDGQWQPFVVGTLGATHFAPDASGSDSLTRFSVGLGGGVRFFPTEHFGLYFAGRGLFTFVGTDTFIESESGSLTIEIDGGGLWQFLLQAGVIFAF